MTKQRLRENLFISMGAYASHRQKKLSFDRWHESIVTTKDSKYIKEIKSEINKKYKEE